MKRSLEHRNPEKLKNHPKNAEIYGTIPDPEFVEHIKKYGVLCPLLITPENVVIGGHRRRQAAIMAGIKDVLVIVCRGLSELDVCELLLADNKYRDKTTEQRAREYEFGLEIEKKRAEERQKAGKKAATDLTSNLTEGTGEAAAIAAEKVGMSKNTAKKAAKVVQKIDEAEAAGDTETAEHLRETLNKSVSAAAKEIEPKADPPKDSAGNPIPKALQAVFARAKEFGAISRAINKAAKDAKELQENVPGCDMKLSSVEKDLRNASSAVKFAAPYAVCAYCKGKSGKCEACKGRRWLTKTQWGNVPGDMK